MAGTLHRRRQARPQCRHARTGLQSSPHQCFPWPCSMDADGTYVSEQTERWGVHSWQHEKLRRRQDGVRVPDAGDQPHGSLCAHGPFRHHPCMRALMCSDAMDAGTHDCDPGCTVSAASRVPPSGCLLADCLHRGKNLPWQRVTSGAATVLAEWPARALPATRRTPMPCGSLAGKTRTKAGRWSLTREAKLTHPALPGLQRYDGLQCSALRHRVWGITALIHPGPAWDHKPVRTVPYNGHQCGRPQSQHP